MLFIPLLVLFVALSLGKPEHFRLPKWANYLFSVSAILFLLVLTNDFHEYTFGFSKGLLYIENKDYSHEIVYFLVIGWIVLCVVAAFCFMVLKSRVPGSKKRIFLPCIFLLALVGYNILYWVIPDVICSFLGDLTVVICVLVTAILESCIQCGLIQSNTHYNELFRGSKIRAVIVDDDYHVQYTTSRTLNLSPEQMREARSHSVDLDESTVLESMELEDGAILWLEDVSELRRLQEDLKSSGAVLSEEAQLLAEEVRQKEEKAIAYTRNYLYDAVASEIAPQIAEINRLIAERSDDAEKRKKALKKASKSRKYR